MMAGADDRGASAFPHRSVLLDASVEALVRKPDGRYIDGTFGRGGHSRLILGRLGAQGRLLAFDKDPDAIREAEALAAEDARFSWFHGSFAEIALAMARRGWASVDGVLLDLGVSSPQLDDPARGFSFMRDGPLDMRMDPRQSPSAAEWLATAEEQAWPLVLLNSPLNATVTGTFLLTDQGFASGVYTGAIDPSFMTGGK